MCARAPLACGRVELWALLVVHTVAPLHPPCTSPSLHMITFSYMECLHGRHCHCSPPYHHPIHNSTTTTTPSPPITTPSPPHHHRSWRQRCRFSVDLAGPSLKYVLKSRNKATGEYGKCRAMPWGGGGGQCATDHSCSLLLSVGSLSFCQLTHHSVHHSSNSVHHSSTHQHAVAVFPPSHLHRVRHPQSNPFAPSRLAVLV